MNAPTSLRVLIADDAAEVAERLASALSDLPGVEILGPAADGHEALRLFESHGPHLAVLDLHMPRMSGLEVLAAIRSRTADAIVAICTMHDSQELKEASMQAGANHFIPKNNALEAITAIIEALRE